MEWEHSANWVFLWRGMSGVAQTQPPVPDIARLPAAKPEPLPSWVYLWVLCSKNIESDIVKSILTKYFRISPLFIVIPC